MHNVSPRGLEGLEPPQAEQRAGARPSPDDLPNGGSDSHDVFNLANDFAFQILKFAADPAVGAVDRFELCAREGDFLNVVAHHAIQIEPSRPMW